ncbi:MAG: DUF1007 family protein [Desulfatiglandales bacterium]
MPRIALCCLFCILIFKVQVFGHAHVWIYTAVIVHFDKGGMAGFKQEWVFDEMFSHMIIHDYDKNQNGVFEPAEVEEIYKGAFSNLENFSYFTNVKINGKPFEITTVQDFNAKIVKDRVVYHFFVPCRVEASSYYKEVRIGIYDESYYTNITVLEDQIFITNDVDYDYYYSVESNEDEPYYYGQVYPEEIVLKFREKRE